jgi:hypothetical protein
MPYERENMKRLLFALLFSTMTLGNLSAFELKEETPAERCDVTACNGDCVKYYGSADSVGDYGPLPIAICQGMCADQKPFCLAHDGVTIQAPDIAPSSMGKYETLFCAKNRAADVCRGIH